MFVTDGNAALRDRLSAGLRSNNPLAESGKFVLRRQTSAMCAWAQLGNPNSDFISGKHNLDFFSGSGGGWGAGMGVSTATNFTWVDFKTNQTCKLAH